MYLEAVMTQTTDIWDLVAPYLAAERLELDDLEMTGRAVRVVVDGDGVHVDRLAELSRGLSRLLDNETDLGGSYRLEVTSPGLERKLKRPAHYEKSLGRELVVKARDGDSKRTVRGVLTDVGGDGFDVEGDEGKHRIRFDEVVTAKTVFRWEETQRPGR